VVLAAGDDGVQVANEVVEVQGRHSRGSFAVALINDVEGDDVDDVDDAALMLAADEGGEEEVDEEQPV
jgi:hypothetical protein